MTRGSGWLSTQKLAPTIIPCIRTRGGYLYRSAVVSCPEGMFPKKEQSHRFLLVEEN